MCRVPPVRTRWAIKQPPPLSSFAHAFSHLARREMSNSPPQLAVAASRCARWEAAALH
jgi:hypothetical protein